MPNDARLPRAALAVLAASVFAALTTEVLPVGLLPVIADGLHTSRSHIGLLVSAYAVVVALGSLPATAVLAHLPKKLVLAWLLGGYAVSNVVFALAHAYWLALAARAVGGLAHAAFFSVVFSTAVAIVPRERAGRAIAAVSSGTVFGLALGVPLGTVLGTAVGWRWAFAVTALLLAVLAAATLVLVPTTDDAVTTTRRSVLAAAASRPLALVAGLIVVITLAQYTVFTYVSPVLLRAGVGRDDVGLVLLGYGAAGVVGLLLAGAFVDRHLRTTVAVTVAVIAGCFVAIAVCAHSTSGTVIAVVVWGMAFGSLPTSLQACALRAAPDAPDASPAIVNAAFNVGIAGGGVLGAVFVG